MIVERADFDDLVTLVGQAPPWEKDRAAGVRILLRAIGEGKANAPDQILQRWTWKLAKTTRKTQDRRASAEFPEAKRLLGDDAVVASTGGGGSGGEVAPAVACGGRVVFADGHRMAAVRMYEDGFATREEEQPFDDRLHPAGGACADLDDARSHQAGSDNRYLLCHGVSSGRAKRVGVRNGLAWVGLTCDASARLPAMVSWRLVRERRMMLPSPPTACRALRTTLSTAWISCSRSISRSGMLGS